VIHFPHCRRPKLVLPALSADEGSVVEGRRPRRSAGFNFQRGRDSIDRSAGRCAKAFGREVRIMDRRFPTTQHPNALTAARWGPRSQAVGHSPSPRSGLARRYQDSSGAVWDTLRLTPAFQPRRPIVTPAAVGCMPLLDCRLRFLCSAPVHLCALGVPWPTCAPSPSQSRKRLVKRASINAPHSDTCLRMPTSSRVTKTATARPITMPTQPL